MLQRIAALLPVALLAGLVAVGTLADGSTLTLDARVVGPAVAALLFRAPFLVVVVVAAVVTALTRLSFG